ncbi:molybdopterin-dependent oxidoreductase [Marinivivus vitaminiproducens]|uniref:molybdopterin-dependent oxidoreductase n=1 Tax=Marinivivus vitaminiproducens TaxID=3035935 RepID=UPI0027A947B1|nr:molybdopterin-dependent oxidoreductase [Geminicoccaceae bacterium SCSIO 64248]
MRHLTLSHWGVNEIERGDDGAPVLKPWSGDPDPSGIGTYDLADVDRLRIRRPVVRKGWLENGPVPGGGRGRGRETFVEIPWDHAQDLIAAEIGRVQREHGNSAIFGGSYGWSSAGRFHHAVGQLHRFLNTAGGYVASTDSYSLGAGRVIMPRVVAPIDTIVQAMTSWDVLERHTGLFVCFGGVPLKNTQISSGGAGRHRVRDALGRMNRSGVRFVNISPVRDDLETGGAFEWIPIRPNTDTALMLALAYVLDDEGLVDREAVARLAVGYDRFRPYLRGEDDGVPKTPAWAEAITGVPAGRIALLARDCARHRTMLNCAWALQRATGGEQPFWMTVTLAAMLGQIGLPGGGFGIGYGAMNAIGSARAHVTGPTLPQGTNPVDRSIPVARIADMLLKPGEAFRYDGRTQSYPDIRLVYWVGGNPFHHHQDLNRLRRAWARPETIVCHEQYWTPTARRADIVLPASTTLERDDIGYSTREGLLIAMRKAREPLAEARSDYEAFRGIAERMGLLQAYTEGRSEREWLVHLYETYRTRAAGRGVAVPGFERFWADGLVELPSQETGVVFLDAFRADPEGKPLATPSGRIEIVSERIESHGDGTCRGHPRWYEPLEWLGSPKAAAYPLHLVSDQPARRLHSQLDHSSWSRGGKVHGREPAILNPADADARGIEDGDPIRLFNDRGACLATARLSDGVAPGVVKLSTGAWYDPDETGLEKHGNPNVLTLDMGASALSQGCSAQTCLIEVERWRGDLPRVTAFDLPDIEERS